MRAAILPPQLCGHGLGVVVAVLLVVVSLGGLGWPETYARETPSWALQAIAQDWFDLIVAAPVLAIAAALAARGSRWARFVLCGALAFAVYTLAIYCFAVRLNALFLVYCAAFGAAMFGLAMSAGALARDRADAWFGDGIPRRLAAIVLIAIGVVFALLWLAHLIPAAITGEPPRELAETGLATNPVHVIDLSLVLPLHVIAGITLWHRRPLGLVLAPVLLAFGALMAASIALLTAMAGGWPIAIVMTAMAILEGAVLGRVLRVVRTA
jgi:hypothetical protein